MWDSGWVLRIAKFFDVSVDYLLTGVSSYNKEYSQELGLSEAAVKHLKRAKALYPQVDPDPARVHTIPYLDYKQLFASCDVIGLEYKNFAPWEAGMEIHAAVEELNEEYDRIILIANSIGAYFSMNADIEIYVTHVFFISPIVDMEKLISDMMGWAGITESELQKNGTIHTDFGEDLSWECLSYVREHPVDWNVPTDILDGSADNLTSVDTIMDFAQAHHVSITVMKNGEHWFHTEEQMQFLDNWLKNKLDS